MTPPGPFQQLRDLKRASPKFHEQLSDFFRGDEYRGVFPELEMEGLAWLAEYLGNVGLQTIFLRVTLSTGVGSRRYFRSRKSRIPAILARTREDSRRWESSTEIVRPSRVSPWVCLRGNLWRIKGAR
jgi:hypothetical protein